MKKTLTITPVCVCECSAQVDENCESCTDPHHYVFDVRIHEKRSIKDFVQDRYREMKERLHNLDDATLADMKDADVIETARTVRILSLIGID